MPGTSAPALPPSAVSLWPIPLTEKYLRLNREYDTYFSSHPANCATMGTLYGLLSCNVSADRLTIAAVTELHGEDMSILYW